MEKSKHKPLDWTEFDNICIRPRPTETNFTQAVVNPAYLFRPSTSFVVGALSGTAATFCTHWIDTVKVRMQAEPTRYRNVTNCLVRTVRKSGPLRLYHGVTPALVASTFRSAVLFSFYGLNIDIIRRLEGCHKDEELRVHQYALAGAMTGVCASATMCPVDVIKLRLQSGKNRKGTIPATVIHIVRKAGFFGLYRGLTAMWAKDIPGAFMYFGSYYSLKKTMKSVLNKEELGPMEMFLCGTVGGFLYSAVYPMDTIKTRVQVRCHTRKHRGVIKTIKHVKRTEGLSCLCYGMRAYMIRLPLFSGIQFLTYEMITAYINNR